jgi:sugar/nucleoside kinase (ribokinase family)
VVLGDLMLDVVIAPRAPLALGTDVPGRVAIVQGGSAANTARWLGRLGARSSLIAAVGRDPAGRALVTALRDDGVIPRVVRLSGVATGRIGVLVSPNGERSFVADRGAADRLSPAHVKPSWFDGAQALHMPIYSLLGEPLGLAGRRAIELTRIGGGSVSLDLASVGPLLDAGRRAAVSLVEDVAPDLLFATASESEALLGTRDPEGLLDLAAIAVVKRGSKGATVLTRLGPSRSRFEIATEHLAAADTTGAGDAFDAGFLVGWFGTQPSGRSSPAALRRAALAGHRAAARQISGTRAELTFA